MNIKYYITEKYDQRQIHGIYTNLKQAQARCDELNRQAELFGPASPIYIIVTSK